jgi:hypothetical protein
MRWQPRSLDSGRGQNRHFMSSFALLLRTVERRRMARNKTAAYPCMTSSPHRAETLDATPPSPPLPHSLSLPQTTTQDAEKGALAASLVQREGVHGGSPWRAQAEARAWSWTVSSSAAARDPGAGASTTSMRPRWRAPAHPPAASLGPSFPSSSSQAR